MKKNNNLFWLKLVIISAFFALAFLTLRIVPFTKDNLPLVPFSPTPTPSPKATVENVIREFKLSIPGLGITAPVIPNVSGSDQAAYDKALENGVAQLAGTAKPGENGNIFIFGHSSFYWYKPGNYKFIFKNLGKIKIGDEIDLSLNGKKYQYYVTDKRVVDPSQVDVLAKTPKEQVTLMTCTPPGTTWQRLIVVAKPK